MFKTRSQCIFSSIRLCCYKQWLLWRVWYLLNFLINNVVKSLAASSSVFANNQIEVLKSRRPRGVFFKHQATFMQIFTKFLHSKFRTATAFIRDCCHNHTMIGRRTVLRQILSRIMVWLESFQLKLDR